MTARYHAIGRTVYRRIFEASENPGGLYGDDGLRLLTADSDVARVDLIVQALETGEAAAKAGRNLWQDMEAIRVALVDHNAQLASDLQDVMDSLAATIPSFKAPGP